MAQTAPQLEIVCLLDFAAEKNPKSKALYQPRCHLGATQGDIANLKAEDMDQTRGTISFTRRKTGVPVFGQRCHQPGMPAVRSAGAMG
ncbi:hypothetical protein GC207_07905 [bacterium]|nr:hypothetical protein [bacterium]